MGGVQTSQFSRHLPQHKAQHRLMTKQQSISLKSIDSFVRIVLNQVNRNSSLRAVVDNPLALECFSQYMASQIGVSPKTTCSLLGLDDVETISYPNPIEAVSVEIQTKLAMSFSEDETAHSRLHAFARVSIQNFFCSPFYSRWRVMECRQLETFLYYDAQNSVTTLPELLVAGSSDLSAVNTTASNVLPINYDQYCNNIKCTSDNQLSSEHPVLAEPLEYEPNAQSYTNQAIASCDQLEVAALLSSDRWLVSLICSAETLPIGITVSKVCNRPPGTGIFDHYPLVYVNNHFAHKCGHRHREDVMGQGFRFMHNNGTIISDKGLDQMEDLSFPSLV
eukprot:gene35499-46008_t